MTGIILFDGVCNFCNGSVQFIIKRDQNKYFKFASLQSEVGAKLLMEYGVNSSLDSFVLIEDGKLYTKSEAALLVCRSLNGLWKWGYAFRIIPLPIRNWIYEMIAKNRYRWFGKRDSCMIPSKEDQERFLV
ncbi:thiol-disulfide oxidoreductase DCC family protein [Heyndrickxia oleronia]|uniref:Thiol-disulfide oxidoreductase n=1 Tax=Heyndrickxia oleronia TaxID=38875 RepID=A0A8E2IAH7_9BACI|nr:thiol-disulfide oxidoreductase DCC family protein [Heyndrickxia oleronia]MBU5210641.1 thiol-disulfide oxidoreductase DCC family protein [Heyndrickxia oleronia]MCI1593330.1 thiol-disulfide oxidoreductase DCC family protein [Heyndrickxia oleronia]MCI1613037.1 thiol-disulfide oxidoreductase DCC family protein [Heyndrickxia oleronia]MCI1761073.1 thiol-disulfide oxidoreductase DCC family protein [Heyndrickxia oleronia]MEC1375241.1 thiol-disulfide oxidoreductase DCC family protein [Heyndrickxia o